MKDLAKAKEFFRDDHFATDVASIVIEASDTNYAKCSMKIEKKHCNAMNRVMGGAIYTLADFTFAVAANEPDRFTVTTVSQISYLSAAKGDTLYAETTLIKDGRSACFYEINITDNLGTRVAVVMTNGMHV